jgi:hypothetical protein
MTSDNLIQFQKILPGTYRLLTKIITSVSILLLAISTESHCVTAALCDTKAEEYRENQRFQREVCAILEKSVEC